ncbi:hypothetical protein RSAG8_03217, partial [Rhizoctonia solani AG-8 WAC10335]
MSSSRIDYAKQLEFVRMERGAEKSM